MKRGRTEVETCELNGWGVGTRLRGHEEWSGGKGCWTTMVITALGETTVLGRGLLTEKTENGEIVSIESRRDREHSWTLQCREWAVAE